MRSFRSVCLSALVLAAPAVAVAADMPWGRGPVVIGERSPQELEIGTGWYLRGDVGYSKATAPSMTLDTDRFTGIGRNGAFAWGGGFGYKFNDWFRADLTVDQISSYGLKRRIGSLTCFTTDTCSVDGNYDGTVMPIMANGYIDLGGWHGFSPYIGGGVGAARLKSSGTLTYTDSSAVTYVTSVDRGAKWSPAFAAMAGFTIDIGSGLQLDAGYRYLWLTDGSTGPMTQVGGGSGLPSTLDYKNTGFHQGRVGLRYFVN